MFTEEERGHHRLGFWLLDDMSSPLHEVWVTVGVLVADDVECMLGPCHKGIGQRLAFFEFTGRVRRPVPHVVAPVDQKTGRVEDQVKDRPANKD